jgi:hypothetical protein
MHRYDLKLFPARRCVARERGISVYRNVRRASPVGSVSRDAITLSDVEGAAGVQATHTLGRAVPCWPGRLRCVVGLLALAVMCGGTRAQDADPPGRVARLSDTEGSVSLQPAGVQDWTAGEINRPITTGDRLWSDRDSRAELDLGAAAIRIASSTDCSFFNLDDRTVQLQLTAGTLIVSVRDLSANQLYEIDTPSVAVTLLAVGAYRIEVSAGGDTTTVKVSQGGAQVDGGVGSITIATQQMARFSATLPSGYEIGTLGVLDDFDAWSAARERGLMNSESAEYVAPDVPGASDLDNNGTWQLTPDYGYVWAPTVVAAGWAPYRFGHWAWIAPWGWTWIDNSPWGFAPFHYGRWVLWNSAWCWVPGPRHGRPVYTPAAVGWAGGPGRAAPAEIGGQVGWFPLGPHEVYVPAVAVSAGYLRRVNLANTLVNATSVATVYQNSLSPAHYVNITPSAVTAVPQALFAAGQPLRGRAVHVSAAVLAQTAVLAAAPAIAPLPQSVLGPPGKMPVTRPPLAYLNRPVLVRTQPPRAPAPFQRELTAIQANAGRALTGDQLRQLQPPAASAPVRVLTGAAPLRPASASAPVSEATNELIARAHALETRTLPSTLRPSVYRALPQATPDPAVPGAATSALTQAQSRERAPYAAPSAVPAAPAPSAPRVTPQPSEHRHGNAPTPVSAPRTPGVSVSHYPPSAASVHSSSMSAHESSTHPEEHPSH